MLWRKAHQGFCRPALFIKQVLYEKDNWLKVLQLQYNSLEPLLLFHCTPREAYPGTHPWWQSCMADLFTCLAPGTLKYLHMPFWKHQKISLLPKNQFICKQHQKSGWLQLSGKFPSPKKGIDTHTMSLRGTLDHQKLYKRLQQIKFRLKHRRHWNTCILFSDCG